MVSGAHDDDDDADMCIRPEDVSPAGVWTAALQSHNLADISPPLREELWASIESTYAAKMEQLQAKHVRPCTMRNPHYADASLQAYYHSLAAAERLMNSYFDAGILHRAAKPKPRSKASAPKMSEYEISRAKAIEMNEAMMDQLGLRGGLRAPM